MSSQPPNHGAQPIPHRTYSSLVQGDADLVGLVAYALYKRDKLKFCDQFKAKNSRSPDDAELSIFIYGSNLDTRLQGYRAEAEKLLETLTEFQLEDAINQLQADFNEKLATKLSEAKSWGRSILEALLGSVVVAVVWAAVVLALYTNKVGWTEILRDIVGLSSGQAIASPAAAGK